MRIIIAGSRDFDDYPMLRKEVLCIMKLLENSGHDIRRKSLEIVSGTCRGADLLGEKYAEEFSIKVKRMPAKWSMFGKRAGYIRNAEMAKYASEDNELGVLIAFWNNSKGTKHMIDLAHKENLKVFIVRF